jgi:hypothetical protein
MLKLQPDTKPIKTKIAGESLFNGVLRLLYLSLVKLAARTFNLVLFNIFLSKIIWALESGGRAKCIPVPVDTKLPL